MLRKIATCLSGLLLVGSLGLWLASSYSVGLPCRHKGYLLAHEDMRLVVWDGRITLACFAGFDVDQFIATTSNPPSGCPTHGAWTATIVLDTFARAAQFKDRTRSVIVPLWLPPLVSAVLPSYTLLLWHHRCKRKWRGLCAKCAYDLRGLMERRCPECGTPFKAGDAGYPSWYLLSTFVLRRSASIMLLLGLFTSIGLWGLSYFQVRYRRMPLLFQCHQGGFGWQRTDFTAEELEYLMAANPSTCGLAIGGSIEELTRKMQILSRPRFWGAGFDGLGTQWLPSRSPSPRPSFFVPLWIPTVLLGSTLGLIQLRRVRHRRKRGRLDFQAPSTAP